MNKINALVVVIVGGALDAVSSELIDHKDFNFHDGFKRLISIAIVGAIIAFAAAFNQHLVTTRESKTGTGGIRNAPLT